MALYYYKEYAGRLAKRLQNQGVANGDGICCMIEATEMLEILERLKDDVEYARDGLFQADIWYILERFPDGTIEQYMLALETIKWLQNDNQIADEILEAFENIFCNEDLVEEFINENPGLANMDNEDVIRDFLEKTGIDPAGDLAASNDSIDNVMKSVLGDKYRGSACDSSESDNDTENEGNGDGPSIGGFRTGGFNIIF